MELAAAESQHEVVDNDQDEDDAEYYRKEVGAEPDHDLFTAENPRKRRSDDTDNPRGLKKMRLDKKIKKKYQTNPDKKFNKNNQGNKDKKFNKNNRNQDNRFKKDYQNDKNKKVKKTYQVNQSKKFKNKYQANQRGGKRRNK